MQITVMKATEHYFPVVLFILMHKVVLTFESVAEILKYRIIVMKATEYCSIFMWCYLFICFTKIITSKNKKSYISVSSLLEDPKVY